MPSLPRSRAAWSGAVPAHRAACGTGFVYQRGEPTHAVVSAGLGALERLAHRGALDADGRSGDGAGILIQIPRDLFGEATAVATLFSWDDRARSLVDEVFGQLGLEVARWREVPVDESVLGPRALADRPAIWQALISAEPGADADQRLYVARRRLEARAAQLGIRLYVPSASSRTLVYKALVSAPDLRRFYLDLQDDACRSQLAVFHQRYSTNTLPDWRLAQPFRLLAHNGEINTLAGNRSWMHAREAELDPELQGVIQDAGSDSAALDNVLELLTGREFTLPEALMALVPDAWEGRADLAPRVRDFYRYQSIRFEPWDGPAALVFSDGDVVGAALDRNGLRPLRYQVTRSGMVVAASEAGVVPLKPDDVLVRGRLGPGQLLLVDVREGRILGDHQAKSLVAGGDDYGELADRLLVPVERHHLEPAPIAHAHRLQRLHGWTAEDVKFVVGAMAATGHEPIYSMGDDTPIPPFARTPRRLCGHLRQRFAQVTNPAIDSLRERSVMSLRTLLGARHGTLTPASQEHLPPAPNRRGRTLPSDAGRLRLLELGSPVLGDGELARVLESALLLDATFGTDESLTAALHRLCAEALASEQPIVVLSDRRAGVNRLPVPGVLAAGAVHQALLRARLRLQVDVVSVTGDALDVHDVAMLVSAGASAVHPYLALDAARAQGATPLEAEKSYRFALDEGLLKVMAKLGISAVQSYCGAQAFEAAGLGAEVMELCFPAAPSIIGGADLAELELKVRENHSAAFGTDTAGAPAQLPDHGRVRFRKAGEWHAFNPLAVRALQRAAQSGERADWEAYLAAAALGRPAALRDLVEPAAANAPPSSPVEPPEAIRARFIATAMSLGALSPEAHATLTAAMAAVGGRSNSGEGGELEAVGQGNRIKQVASARFGVTPDYLERADELEIKIAQGSKPGEGGQLPAGKVTPLIAHLRHTEPGIPLISPPPHHDIYSIEDLAQLIHDLRAANPRAKVGVKLVSETGVGTIAVGVAKAGADYILISGSDGGTGASPLSSIKQAGMPWELGLAEAQRMLCAAGLRERVSLRVDGGLRSGRDILVAALLGAEEFGLGTTLLVALGCDMARQCHLDTCPTGIATQKENLRAKFDGQVAHVVNLLTLLADDVRRQLVRIGAATLDEIIGRSELLKPATEEFDVAALLHSPAVGAPRRSSPLARSSGSQTLPSGPIDNSWRAVSGLPGARMHYSGSAGQSFGAWCRPGAELILEGEANDYVGKGMAGGVVTIRPRPGDRAADPVLAGNTCLYGATGGSLFIAGRAGERFAVRNSGARAVLEGAGDHLCEYMTAGSVVCLGSAGRNAGAGMTGGVLYVRSCSDVNLESVAVEQLEERHRHELRRLVEEHQERTGSALAAALLADWEQETGRFQRLVPRSQPGPATTAAAPIVEPAKVAAGS